MTRPNPAQIKTGFEDRTLRLQIEDIEFQRPVSAYVRRSAKYAQIVASIREVGVIEPPVVTRTGASAKQYMLLDGHLRIMALKEAGETDVICLVSTDDEAFTYNKHVSRIATLQEHAMILKAIKRGVPEARIAKALNIDVLTLKKKEGLLQGICPEVLELLKDKHVPTHTFYVLKRMVPLRQIEVADLMVAMNHYAASAATSMLLATPKDQLVDPNKPVPIKGITGEQKALMERESGNLDREFRTAEQNYGVDHLDLVITTGFLGKMLENARISRYLSQRYPEIHQVFQKISSTEDLAR